MTPSMLVSQVEHLLKDRKDPAIYTRAIAAVESYTASQSARIAELEAERDKLAATVQQVAGCHHSWPQRVAALEAERDAVQKALAPAFESMRRVADNGGRFVMNPYECEKLLALLAAAREGAK